MKNRQYNDHLLTLAFNKAPVGLTLINEHGFFVEVNKTLCNMLGYTKAELEHQPSSVIFPKKNQHEVSVFQHSLFEEEQIPHEKVWQVKTKNGSPIDLLFTSDIFMSENGQRFLIQTARDVSADKHSMQTAECMISATKDIAAQKNSELQLKEMYARLKEHALQLQLSNTELERFAYSASHDLQEPLRMVSSFLQLLEKKCKDSLDEKGREYIHYAVDGSLRMKRLISDLLDYSRVTTHKQYLEPVNMELVISDVLQNLSLQVAEKNAEIKMAALPLLPAADKTQMVQLLQNLVANAVKYSGTTQPVIEIAATEQGNEWLFSVKDNGIGFDEKFADKIFVIFQRLHNRTEYSGTGIGLAICKKIIDRHGGKIYAESVPGKGSTFWFTIKKHLVTEQ